MRTTDSLVNIAPALVAALAEIEGVAKDGSNPAFKAGGKTSQYTTLGAVINASREVLAKHDLGLMQFPGALVDNTLSLETVIIHKSGEWVSGDFQIALGKVDPQGVGSALTYARRYAQKSALNIPDADDDGEAAMDRGRDTAPRTTANDAGKATFNRTANTVLETFVAAMKMNKTVEKVDAWAHREANNITEKLKGSGVDAMQAAFEAYRKELAQKPAPVVDAKGAAGKTLADRAAIFEGALKACHDQDALRHTYDTATRLRDDLDKADPERLEELNAVYQGLYLTLPSKAA